MSEELAPDAGALLARHIARPSPPATHVIEFCTTRTLADGALKPDVLQMLKTMFGLGAFVESGTYRGDTTAHAAAVFDDVHTIELSRALWDKAVRRFRRHPNVSVYLGDSGHVLISLLPRIHRRILFYLDGHYSGGPTAVGVCNTPILAELAAIADAGKSDAVVLIDDIRCFQDSCYPEKLRRVGLDEYPDLRRLTQALLRINAEYQICFLGDALLAFSRDPDVAVSPVVTACAIQRMASVVPGFPDTALNESDEVIRSAQGRERDELMLYDRTYSAFEIEHGYRSFATVWAGLIEARQGKEEDALRRYRRTAEHSLPGWRAPQILDAGRRAGAPGARAAQRVRAPRIALPSRRAPS